MVTEEKEATEGAVTQVEREVTLAAVEPVGDREARVATEVRVAKVGWVARVVTEAIPQAWDAPLVVPEVQEGLAETQCSREATAVPAGSVERVVVVTPEG